jgi:hypothetical protein
MYIDKKDIEKLCYYLICSGLLANPKLFREYSNPTLAINKILAIAKEIHESISDKNGF